MEKILELPFTLISRHISLRVQTDKDAEFINTLYTSVRWQELSATEWPEKLKHAFLDQQLTLQTRHYLSRYDGLWRGIILRRENPVGRLYLWRNGDDLRIVDLSLLPDQRCQGIGTQLLQTVIDQAARTGLGTSLHVQSGNPALALYQRLGFRSVEQDTSRQYQLMRHCPPLRTTGEQDVGSP